MFLTDILLVKLWTTILCILNLLTVCIRKFIQKDSMLFALSEILIVTITEISLFFQQWNKDGENCYSSFLSKSSGKQLALSKDAMCAKLRKKYRLIRFWENRKTQKSMDFFFFQMLEVAYIRFSPCVFVSVCVPLKRQVYIFSLFGSWDILIAERETGKGTDNTLILTADN